MPGNRFATAAGPLITQPCTPLGDRVTCITPLGVIVTQRVPARPPLAGIGAILLTWANLLTTQLTGDPVMRPATKGRHSPAPTSVAASARAAAAGHWTATPVARMTAASVHRFRPNSAMPI